MKKLLRYSLWVLFLGGIMILMGFINHNLKDEKCREVIIVIEDQNRFGFVDEGDILDLLNRNFNTPISQKISDIDCYAIEKNLNEHSAIEHANVYITIDGKLNVALTQRKPILRVFTKDFSFYIDHNGKAMPLSSKFTALVPVATGYININSNQIAETSKNNTNEIDSSLIPSIYKDLFILSDFLQKHAFWDAQIEQVYVNKDSEIELIPRVGNHSIVLGAVDNLDSKFEKLMIFYEKGLSKTGWNEYKTINLMYKNQIVCTKRY